MHQHQQQEYYHNHHHHNSGGAGGRGRGRDRGGSLATPPPPAPRSQCPSMHPSPASASSAVTTASGGGGDACSFGAMYSSPSALQAPVLARYDGVAVPMPQQHAAPTSLAEFCTAPPPAASSWTGGGMAALDDMFLPELLGVGEFPAGDLFGGGGFGQLLQQDRAAASLQELSACYFPNAPAEMWAAAADLAKPPAGLCHSLT
uniref:Uncharacterized protein n=1 Tax=Arundo donax TaxID=35708 RepID=A0A0A9DE63_ARUDO